MRVRKEGRVAVGVEEAEGAEGVVIRRGVEEGRAFVGAGGKGGKGRTVVVEEQD